MYKAAGLSRRLENDPQMQIPDRPRFSEDYLVVDLGEAGLLVQGGEKPQLFRGKAARILLPRLLPLLDGTRTISDLQALFPQVDPAIIRDTIALLFMRGLLEEGPTEEDIYAFSAEEHRRYAQQLQFFGRYTDVSRIAHNRYGTQRRLQEARVLIVANTHLGHAVATHLVAAGLGHLDIWPLKSVLSAACSNGMPRIVEHVDDPKAYSLVVVLIESDTHDVTRRLAAACRAANVPLLRIVDGSDWLEVGPLFTHGEGACYECFRAQLPIERAADSLPSNVETSLALGAYAAMTILMLISGLFPVGLIDRVRRFDAETMRLEEYPLLRLPRCSVCGMGTGNDTIPLRLPDDLALLFHFDTNHKWYIMAPKGHQLHYSPHVSRLMQGAYKTYWTYPKVDLPPLEALPPVTLDLGLILQGLQPHKAHRLTLTHLTQICGWSARWREPGTLPFRFTPSGGGLCSADLYLVVWDVEGVEPGLYHYDGAHHCLEVMRLGDWRSEIAAFVAPKQFISQAGMAIIQTGHFYRLSSKYGARAYRYVHLDAGVMTQSLRLLAHALGLAYWNLGRFADEALTDFLVIPPIQEVPMQVVLIGAYPRGGKNES